MMVMIMIIDNDDIALTRVRQWNAITLQDTMKIRCGMPFIENKTAYDISSEHKV